MNPVSFAHAILQFEPDPKQILLSRNELLRARNNINTNIYFIERGSIRIFTEDGTTEQNIRFGYKHNIVVLMDSFLSGQPSSYFLQALKQTTLTVISKTALTMFLSHHPENARTWQALLEELILQLLEREKDLLTSSPAERYSRLLKRSPQLFQEISNRHIANYLRMSPETLSRLKKH
ncbi:MAG TPA: Crp/Fnr family transcriptional regulator [Niabella sp.]